ncbi:MAG: methylmalonyl Co-A mutase-associated GTPase MeaB [Acidobacteriaceae bacterium]
MRTEISAEALAALLERVRAGDARALARAISVVEDDAPGAAEVLSACFPYTGDSLRIGVTGSPGAGKSTLVDRLARKYREREETVGVLAVDPTSPFTGGAILGDRIRMAERLSDPGVYVRSMATRGALGGLAQTTADAVTVLEASGKQKVLIETVGVGQDEVDIVRLADVTVVVLVPGMGDDVQSIKAGIMEIADIFVINKADREGADRVEKEVRAMQSLASQHAGDDEWVPPMVKTVATGGQGIEELMATIDRMQAWLREGDRLAARRRRYWRERIVEMMRAALLREVRQHGFSPSEIEEYAALVVERREDPYRLVPRLIAERFAVMEERR